MQARNREKLYPSEVNNQTSSKNSELIEVILNGIIATVTTLGLHTLMLTSKECYFGLMMFHT